MNAAAERPGPCFVDGVAAIADRYDAFVLDQWGVMHDGSAPYPGVLDVLNALRRQGKRLVVLSNSGKRLRHNADHLAAIGFDPAMFDGVVTSGEAAWRLLALRSEPPYDRLGRRCFLITRDGDRDVVAGTGVTLVHDIDDADFIFLAGVDSPVLGIEDYRPLLERAAARKLTLICSNPDRMAPSLDQLILAPGTLAELYADLGGPVGYVGKPHPPIYALVARHLEGVPPARTVAVGDSLQHDIRGANLAGYAAAFVSGGLHAADFPLALGVADQRQALARLSVETGARVDWVLPALRW